MQDEHTPVHAMFVAFYGIVITMVIGSFCCYHLYLISSVFIPSFSAYLLLTSS